MIYKQVQQSTYLPGLCWGSGSWWTRLWEDWKKGLQKEEINSATFWIWIRNRNPSYEKGWGEPGG